MVSVADPHGRIFLSEVNKMTPLFDFMFQGENYVIYLVKSIYFGIVGMEIKLVEPD
jgi:hypothetical protein